MTPRQFLAASVFWAMLVPVGSTTEDLPVVSPASTGSNHIASVSFDRFANIHYRHREVFDGCLTTGAVVQEGLQQWFPQLNIRQSITDGTPRDLENFLDALPGADDSDVSVVYLASIQSAAGAWEFVGKEQQLWSQTLRNATVKPHPFRIVILDSCYAAVATRAPEWSGKLATLTLLAGGARELTYELDLSTRMPIDFCRRYPSAWEWTQQHLPENWNRKMSFLGLMWLAAFVETSAPPRTLDDWQHLFDRGQRLAEEFRKKYSRRWASSVQSFRSAEETKVPEKSSLIDQ